MVATVAPPTLDVQTAYALLAPANRSAALRWLRPSIPPWLDSTDLEQMVWEALGYLVARYRPQPGIPAQHYIAAAFPGQLYKVLRWTWAQRSPHAVVYTQPHARVLRQADIPTESDLSTSAALAELLRQLPPRPRQVLWLHAVEGHSFTAIGRLLDCPRTVAWEQYRVAITQARAYWRCEPSCRGERG